MHLPPPQDPREIVGRQKESVVVENLHPRYSKGQPIKPPQQPPPPFAVPPPNANRVAYKLNYIYPHNITYSVVGADLNSVQVTEAEVLSTEVINVVSHDPYLGLRPYEESEKDNFFGRDAERSIVLDKLLVQRLTLLFAASGVGKSSLLNAAVLPQLKDPFGENLTVICYRDWVIQPIEGLCSAVREAIPAASQYPGAENLVDLLRFCCLFTRHPVILILDQFEEFFRYQSGKEDYPALIEQLTALILNTALPVNVLVSMREDFALELNAFKPKLPSLLFENYYRLERMTPAAARVAILEPVEPWGGWV
ncbi:MAG: ATP-binding protein [Thiothrix sp.]|nr:MAG: ATP-binding protein [Thiothrix sp.]